MFLKIIFKMFLKIIFKMQKNKQKLTPDDSITR